jgi:hypothetical protein
LPRQIRKRGLQLHKVLLQSQAEACVHCSGWVGQDFGLNIHVVLHGKLTVAVTVSVTWSGKT